MVLVVQGTYPEWQFRDQKKMETIFEMHAKGQEIPARVKSAWKVAGW